MAQDELKRLTGKLTREWYTLPSILNVLKGCIGQEERIVELRDTHRLESKSQSNQIDRLKAQIEETEALLKASQASQSEVLEDAGKRKAEMNALHAEVEKAKNASKEEEEKRVKAIALLKTVRQKLVKAEKERDDAVKELQTLKDKEHVEREREKEERLKLQAEVDMANQERETAVTGLRTQFDKEIATLKDRNEKEQLALRGQYELEAVTTKVRNHGSAYASSTNHSFRPRIQRSLMRRAPVSLSWRTQYRPYAPRKMTCLTSYRCGRPSSSPLGHF